MTDARLEKQVPEELAGSRLDQALAKMFPEFSRSRLKAWILAGHVSVDGLKPKPRDAVEGGEQVTVRPQAELSVSSEPEALELEIAWEDEALLVVKKSAGLVVHPGAGNLRGTLLNGLLHYAPDLANIPRAGIIHRLDKDTSGLLLVAKTLEAHTALVRALAERQISRRYLAICTGVLTGGGTIEAPIARHPVDRLRMSVQENGKPALTHYRVIERFRSHTFVRVQLETGRTHQIRVHFAWRRHPLVGDPVYGGRLQLPPRASDELAQALREIRRQALHAVRLSLAHPCSGEPLDIECDPPDDFASLLEALRQDAEQDA